MRTYSSHSGGQHKHDSTASTSYGSTCAKAAGYPVLLASKCMLVGFAANNKGHNCHWREKQEDEDTLLACFARDQQLAPLGASRAGKLESWHAGRPCGSDSKAAASLVFACPQGSGSRTLCQSFKDSVAELVSNYQDQSFAKCSIAIIPSG